MLMGTDRLKKVFGMVQTMIGGDINADMLQLTNCIDGAVQCVNILGELPEWGGDVQRITLRALPTSVVDTDILAKHDHISPRLWRGNVKVKDVSLLSTWNSGWASAESELINAEVLPPFEEMEIAGGYDILCPHGEGQIIVLQEIDEVERKENEGDWQEGNDEMPSSERSASALESDIEELARASVEDDAHTAWVRLDADNIASKPCHKVSVLQIFSEPLSIRDSKDWLKHVGEYSQFEETVSGICLCPSPANGDQVEMVSVDDPAMTLVRSDQCVFVAVFQIISVLFRRAQQRKGKFAPPRFEILMSRSVARL